MDNQKETGIEGQGKLLLVCFVVLISCDQVTVHILGHTPSPVVGSIDIKKPSIWKSIPFS